jgi:ubiquinone/menaquinone biosynthesis C-methylase UbiE/uncharacterized protein YbaR (Trm112 family)
LKLNLVDYLICPKCNKNLTLKSLKSSKLEVQIGILKCQNNHKFHIKNGIPRFVTDTKKDFVKTEDAFSAKWKLNHKNHQAKEWTSFQQKWFFTRFGWNTMTNFKNFLKPKKLILEAGTGVGNTAKLLSSNPRSTVFAIDASDSIEFAYKKYGKKSNLHFLQADLRNLPFKKKFFDFILSDQVLHHTDNTKKSFTYLTKFLKKNSNISIYVYNKKAPIREFADDFIRKTTVNMSVKECIEFSKDMSILGKNLLKINKKILIPKDIPLLGIKKGTYDIQRFIYWHFLKCFWDPSNNLDRSIGVNFDWYYPKFAFRHTSEEVKKWYKDSKIKITHFKEIESGISVTGKKLI